MLNLHSSIVDSNLFYNFFSSDQAAIVDSFYTLLNLFFLTYAMKVLFNVDRWSKLIFYVN